MSVFLLALTIAGTAKVVSFMKTAKQLSSRQLVASKSTANSLTIIAVAVAVVEIVVAIVVFTND